MTAMIEAFQEIDGYLAHSIKGSIKPSMLLEDIEAGSLRTWLRNTLESIDEESLKSGDYKKIIGSFLVKAKRIIINWTDERTEVTSEAELVDLQRQILNEAAKTGVMPIPVYSPVPTSEIARSVELIATAIEPLHEGDAIAYLPGSETPVEFNRSFHVVPESLADLLVKESLTNEAQMILMIKKPDFLGDSRWDFRHGSSPLLAKMQDAKWVEDFHRGSVPIFPGDALRAIVRTTVRYGYDGDVVDTQHDVMRVLDVIRAIRPSQTELPLGQ